MQTTRSALLRHQKLNSEQASALARIEEGRDKPIGSMTAPSGRRFLIWTDAERQILESLGWSLQLLPVTLREFVASNVKLSVGEITNVREYR